MTSQSAARQAVELAAAVGAEVHFVTVVRDDDATLLRVAGDEWEIRNMEIAEANIRRFVTSLNATVSYTVSAVEGSPAKALISEAERLEADLIVVGNVRMQGMGRILGSVGNTVAHNSSCNVLIVKTV